VGAILTALPIFWDALKGLLARGPEKGEFYMNQFINLAVLACFASGQYLTGGIVATVLVVGHLLENRTLLGTNEAIQSLLKLSHLSAWRLVGGQEEEINTKYLTKGDIVRVRPGNTIPADGIIIFGQTTVNQASITGESIPVELGIGDPVFAGTSNLTGLLEVKVTTTGEDTTLGKVKGIVEEAQQSRAPIMRLTEQYARYYMPLVLIIAGFVLFFTRDLQRAISVLIVSVPCTLVLAGPAAMVAALAAASRMGILIKSVRFFEAANEIDTVVFDKTGTLTTGELQVTTIRTERGFDQGELLAITASVAQHSTHPVARAIVKAAHSVGSILFAADKLEEKHGRGMLARVERQEIIIGRREWLVELGVNLPAENGQADDVSILFIGIERIFAGSITLSDTQRAESEAALAGLKASGVENLILLTGDRSAVAVPLATRLKITKVSADCLPEQKLAIVQALREQGHKVLVIGDGVNDAPALAAGNVGVAMGALGSDIAIQTADVTLITSDLRRLPHFIELSRNTLRIINQNMICGLVFIAIAIIFSGLGLISPIAAAFVHELGAFFVIFNSARLLRFEEKSLVTK